MHRATSRIGAVLALLVAVSCAGDPETTGGAPAETDGGMVPDTTGSIAPEALQAGTTYRLTEPTPILPDPDPGDPAMAMVETVTLDAPVLIRVVQRVETAGVLWYEIRLVDGDSVGGWVSLPGLGDQQIVPDP